MVFKKKNQSNAFKQQYCYFIHYLITKWFIIPSPLLIVQTLRIIRLTRACQLNGADDPASFVFIFYFYLNKNNQKGIRRYRNN